MAILLGLLVAGAIYERLSSRADSTQNPPPGKLVDVGGVQLHLNCTGSGSPVVVLESGLSDSSLVWSEVQARHSPNRRVCSYDRAGIGWSETGGTYWNATHAVQQLHTLLQRAGEAPPYVLVGHSLGATYVRLFALTYPDEVSALVLAEPPILPGVSPALVAPLKAMRMALQGLSRVGLIRLLGRLGLLKILFGGASPPKEISHAAGYLYRPESIRASIREVDALAGTVKLVNELSNPGSFQDLPLLIISAHKGRPHPPSLAEGLQNLSRLSSRGRIVSVESSHFVHFDEPEFVAKYIEEIIGIPHHVAGADAEEQAGSLGIMGMGK